MIRPVVFILLFAILIQFSYKLVIVTYYNLNKSYITDFLCVNKSNPTSDCQGKCFLSKRLGESQSKNSQLMELLKTELNCCLPEFAITLNFSLKEFTSCLFFIKRPVGYLYLWNNFIFHPPQLLS
jgi:hypothetical protein